MVKIVKSTIQEFATVTRHLLSHEALRTLVKSLTIQLVISLSLFAESNPPDGFNVIVKDLSIADKISETEYPVKKLKEQLATLKSSPQQGLYWKIAAEREKKEKVEKDKRYQIDEKRRIKKIMNDRKIKKY